MTVNLDHKGQKKTAKPCCIRLGGGFVPMYALYVRKLMLLSSPEETTDYALNLGKLRLSSRGGGAGPLHVTTDRSEAQSSA